MQPTICSRCKKNVAVIFVTAKMGPVLSGSMTAITVVFGVFMDCLELLVAFIQAYVFTMLSSVFIGLSRQEEHHSGDGSVQEDTECK